MQHKTDVSICWFSFLFMWPRKETILQKIEDLPASYGSSSLTENQVKQVLWNARGLPISYKQVES